MKPLMSKKLYVGIFAASMVATVLFAVFMFVVMAIGDLFSIKDLTTPIGGILLVLTVISGMAALFIQTVLYFVVLGKMWDSIQDGQTEITVGKAIGFLFIPFFNIYWGFRVWSSFPKEYNRFIARKRLTVPPLSEGIFIILPIIQILCIFYIPLLIFPFVLLMATNKVCDAVNSINKQAKLGRNFNF
jgi:hypothetical protein